MFEFAYSGPERGALEITHAGGDGIPAGNLEIRSSRGTRVEWPELGSTVETPSEDVTEGSTAEIHEGILNWPTDVRPDETVRVIYLDESGAPTTLGRFPETEDGTTTGAATSEKTEEPTEERGDATVFADSFDDSQFLDRWQYVNDDQRNGTTLSEGDGVLSHEASFSYSAGRGNIVTPSFDTNGGVVTATARIRTLETDFWGYGIGIRYPDGGIGLKEHKWEGFDRLAAFGVEDRPERYASDYRAYGEQPHKAKFASATDSTEWLEYSMTVDTEAGELLRVQRGDEVFEPGIALLSTSDQIRLQLGGGGGHNVEYDSVELRIE